MSKLFDLISQVNIDSECDKTQIKEKIELILKRYLNNQNFNFKRCLFFLKKYQTHAKNKNKNIFEIHILLDKNNEYIDCSINRKQGGEPIGKMLEHIDTHNSHLIHNHPSNGSLSTSDWNFLANHLKLKMTAVNDFGSYFTGSVIPKYNTSDFDDKILKLDQIKSILHSNHGQSLTPAGDNYICKDISQYIENIEIWLNHKLGLVLSREKLSKYSFQLNNSDTINKDITTCLDITHFNNTINSINLW